ncbi:metal-dependent hydrolase [Natrinema longum]|uniref:Metal-dependent hydrolase n=1 Tax=Natrinema longum TaxID=370324 RepID=A0A8A2UBH1_9EURY|nr:metal-dependent hydrolase [Natrinema longum]MBZ6496596.1 metal-dependent hydrolase [Natrinema longum]QSW85505.1 metal-dependent hydrolase [Natrinema longum]
MGPGRLAFLAGAFATHAIVGYALVRGGTGADPRLGIVFGLVPDVDFLFLSEWGQPFVHRGITHTPLFVLAVVAGSYAIARSREIAAAVALALGSHLVIDALSPMGIDPLFPLETNWSPGLPVHGPTATVVLWTASVGLLAWRTDAFRSGD